MSILPQKQLSLADIYSDCTTFFESDKPQFLSLLENNLNLSALIPSSFSDAYYAHTGRPREHPLEAMLWALLLQRIFSIPTDTLLITFLKYSTELRDFCGFSRVPDASRLTRFKQEFIQQLELFFHHLVDLTEPICQQIDPDKAAMTLFDTSGIEAYVTENNPKYANRIIKQLKAFKKSKQLDDDFDPYKAAYSKMPSHAAANHQVKQLYINGHFCYVYKFGLITNGLGIVRDISFYDKAFFDTHPDIIIDKKSDAPDHDKSLADAKALLPVLTDFYHKHPSFKPHCFIGDAAFDTINIYDGLFNSLHFKQAFIPLNRRAALKNADYTINDQGIPCCPHDPSLEMKPESQPSNLRSKIKTFKFVCPKMRWQKCDDGKYHRRHNCDNPCTTSPSGRMIYVYPQKNLRAYPGVIRGSTDWDKTYKIRTVVEQTIHHFKNSFCIAERKTQNAKTLHADLLLAGITQLITVVLADNIHQHQFIRSLKPLIA